ncbi:ABC transporter ATP-binding protein [Luteolibacter ambystomatis]|uniref:ABC transporter ATP-binding protein n=1 Tax=Luteolibacter ambystomatis TaxID=2824561 RepID=A0A975G729_9BACT|nr:ABC transporter ATP-binding protein [Luteolibacter ambystomatis]QUE49985.1 ABC transporter ATP-binding protein [Luteolibacter ambystomatis]
MSLAVSIDYLRKVYRGGFEALAGISLQVPRGSVFGLLGPNGAGKSTMVKSLLTILRPTECRGEMLGRPIGHRATLAKVGFLPEHAKFPDYLTGAQVIHFTAGLAKVPSAVAKRRTGELLERVGMAAWADKRVGTYSKGMKQRVGLAQALVNDPELVFLDEPTDGVDPEGRIEIRKLIETMRAEGKTVFVNSHLLAEVEQVADHVAILARGRIVESGPMSVLTSRGRHYEVRTEGPVPLGLRDKFLAAGWKVSGDRIDIEADNAAAVQPVIDALRAERLMIREVKEARLSLEDLFLSAVKTNGKENGI